MQHLKTCLFAAAATLVSACATEPETPPLSGDLLVRNVRLIDVSGEAPRIKNAASILIANGRIIHVGDGSEPLQASKTLDGDGLTLLPGLTDMHVHVWDEAELPAYLASGVTSIRNMSGMPFHLKLIERIENGELASPHMITTGPILNSPGPNAQINHQMVETSDEARKAVIGQHDAGFERIKIYSNLTKEAYQAIRAEADARGMPITGHPPEGRRTEGIPETRPFNIPFESLLDDRFETLEHIESIVWHGLRNQHDETKARELAKKIAAAQIPVTPTLLAHHNLYRVANEGAPMLTRPGTEWLNPFVQQTEQAHQQSWLKRDPAPVAQDDAFYGRVARIFDEEGVLMVTGSDAGIFTNVPGTSLIEELDLLVDAGISPYRALQMATINPARVLGLKDQACMTSGCLADFVLVEGDPLTDIRIFHAPFAVISQGRLYERADLEELRQTAAQPDLQRTQTNLFQGLEAQGTSLETLGLGNGG